MTLTVVVSSSDGYPGEQTVHFSVDRSGSMADKCGKDGKTKMDHVKHTVQNILTELKDTLVKVSCTAFDHELSVVFDGQLITEDNMNELRKRTDNVLPRGATNLEFAVKSFIKGDQTFNIMLTDGAATAGEANCNTLAMFVPKNSVNFFVGIGDDHSVMSLTRMANASAKGRYYYVPTMEEAHISFGEMLAIILYRVADDVTFVCENCTIYNSDSDEWTDRWVVPWLQADEKKVFHILADDPLKAIISIFDKNNKLLATCQGTAATPCDQREVHKHNVMVLLSSLEYYQMDRQTERGFKQHDVSVELHDDLQSYLKVMRFFVKENGLEDDPFYQRLTTDLELALQSFSTSRAATFSASLKYGLCQNRLFTLNEQFLPPVKQTPYSQGFGRGFGRGYDSGRQTIHRSDAAAADDDDDDAEAPPPAKLMRSLTCSDATPRQLQMARAISTGTDKI